MFDCVMNALSAGGMRSRVVNWMLFILYRLFDCQSYTVSRYSTNYDASGLIQRFRPVQTTEKEGTWRCKCRWYVSSGK